MKKQQKQLTILLVTLLIIIAGFLGIRQYNKVQSEKPEEETGETIVNISTDDIIKFSYTYEGEEYTFVKEDGVWYYDADRSLNITQTSMNIMLMGVAPLIANQALENVTDMSQYGLKEPSRTISFETAEQSYIFNVGDNNSLSDIYYIAKPSETTVYLVPALSLNRFNKTLDDVVEEEEAEETEATETDSDS